LKGRADWFNLFWSETNQAGNIAMALSLQEVEQFKRDGYVCPIDIMDATEAAGLRQQLEAVEAKQDGALEGSQRNKSHCCSNGWMI